MAMDENLNNAPQESMQVWGPLHAWRTLAQLRAVEAAEPLVRLFEKLPDDDWLATELAKVFSLLGAASIPVLAAFMADNDVDEYCRISTPACLKRIALDHPEHRDQCIDDLARQLTSYETNGSGLNAFLVMSLADLKATEAIDVIRKAFLADCVDLAVQGDIEDVEIVLGIRMRRDTPAPKVQLIPGLDSLELDAGLDRGLGGVRTGGFKNPFRRVSRNDPCPCGSGKKFKKCCLH